MFLLILSYRFLISKWSSPPLGEKNQCLKDCSVGVGISNSQNSLNTTKNQQPFEQTLISSSIWSPTPAVELPGSERVSVLIYKLNLTHAALSFWWWFVTNDWTPLLPGKVLFSGELQVFDQNYSLLVIKSVQNTIPYSFQKYIEFVFRKKTPKHQEQGNL